MSRLTAEQKIQPHWWRKTLIGVFLGLSFAYSIIAIFAWYGPGGIDAPVKVQLNMWLVGLIWLLCLPFVYLFKTAGQAFKYLLIANMVGYAVFFALRTWA